MSSQRYPVGIDLGTTFSSISYVDEHGRVETVRMEGGGFSLASAVYFASPTEIIVGNEALNYALIDASCVARAFKPQMGSHDWVFDTGQKQFRPEELSAMVLKKLIAQAEAKIGPIENVVISVPFMFDEVGRRATRHAGEIAGVHVLDTVDEPVAAALAYGHKLLQSSGSGFHNDETLDKYLGDEMVLVYDLGGGTFDLTLMQLSSDLTFRVLATDGDSQLGGEDWDRVLADHLTGLYLEQFDASGEKSPELLQKLLTKAREAKISLSERSRDTVELRCGDMVRTIELERCEFEKMTQHLVERTRMTLQSMLERKDLQYGHLTVVLLVGGSSRMPMIRKTLVREINREIDASLPPDTAISQGAALYAAYRCGDPCMRGVTIRTVNPHALGLLAYSPRRQKHVNDVLIRANQPTEKKVTKTYPVRAGATNIRLVVLQGELPEPEDCVKLGQVEIPDLPLDDLEGATVKVTFSFQENGLLQLHGVLVPGNKLPGDNPTPIEVHLELNVEYSMSEQDVLESLATLAGIEIVD